MNAKNKALDGLRGIASLNVAIAHFVSAFLPALLHNNYPDIFAKSVNPNAIFDVLNSPVATIFYNGHFAVMIFFVLSGYVLSIPYYESSKSGVIKRRLWGRYLRLNLPLAIAVLLSFVVYKLNWYSNVPAGELSGSITWLKMFYQPGISFTSALEEALYQSILLGRASLVPPLWTLKIEFIGSILLLVCHLTKSMSKHIALTALTVLLLIALYGSDSLYIFSIFLGSYLNRFKFKKGLNYIFFGGGIYFGAFQFEHDLYNFLPDIILSGEIIFERKTFYNVIGAVLLTAAVVNGFGKTLLESRPVQFLARISFSMYLLHFIILCSLSSTLYMSLPNTTVALVTNFLIYIISLFAISKVFEIYVDRAAIKVSHQFSAVAVDWMERLKPSTKPPCA